MAAQPLFLFLTLLVFLPPSRGCRDASSADCHKARFVPGHNLVGEGFNIVKLETTGALVVDMKNYMNGNKCTLCYNTLLREEQKLPTSVVDWRIKVSCQRRLSGRMFESSTSVLRENSQSTSTSWKVGLGVEGKGSVALGGTHSKSSSFAMERSRKDKFSYSSLQFNCQYYTFRVHSQPPLSKDFEGALKRLPTTQSPNSRAFDRFFDVYGTHFIRKLNLGGRVKSITAIKTCDAAMKGMKASAVSDCLSIEASGTVKGVTASASVEHCKEKSKKFGVSSGFSAVFTDRITEVNGGYNKVSDILFGTTSNYDAWLKSVQKVPGVVSYQLTPLHMLVRNNPTLKSKLRDAITAYIKRNSVSLACTNKCKDGKPNQDCVCKCGGYSNIDGDCCPRKPGGAKISVYVVKANGLDADIFTASDTYVTVRYNGKTHQTRTIESNDYPRFYDRYDFPDADLTSRKFIWIQMIDRDTDEDDLIGNYKITVPPGGTINKQYVEKLTDGYLYFEISVECHPKLKGPLCNQLIAQPDTSPKKSWGLALATSALPEGTLTTHNNKFL